MLRAMRAWCSRLPPLMSASRPNYWPHLIRSAAVLQIDPCRNSLAVASDLFSEGRAGSRAPEVLEARRGHLRVAHGVLDVAVPEVSLQRPRIVSFVRQRVAAGVAQH